MNDPEDISIVMIGCGRFARSYHLPAIDADPHAEIAAIFDPSPLPENRAIADRDQAAIVGSFADLPLPSGVVMAIVSTPHALHAGHVGLALERGWHVLCDKPFVGTAAEAHHLAGEADRRRLVGAVAFNRRFDHGCLRAREVLRSGAIGAVAYIETVQLGYERAGWALDPALGGGGPYTGRASHFADLIPWLIGRRPTRIRGRLRGDGGARADRGGFIDLHFGQIECRMTCLEEGWHGWDELRIFGEAGLVELRRPPSLPLGWELRVWTRQGGALEYLAPMPNPGQATADFIGSLRDGHKVACSFAEAALSVEIVEQAFVSARAGEAWIDLPAATASDRDPS